MPGARNRGSQFRPDLSLRSVARSLAEITVGELGLLRFEEQEIKALCLQARSHSKLC